MRYRLRVLRTRPGLSHSWSLEIVDQGDGRVVYGHYGIPSQSEALERGLWVLEHYWS